MPLTKIPENIFSKFPGLNQREIAEKLGVSTGLITQWKAGRCFPRLPELQKVIELTGISWDELITGKAPDEPSEAPAGAPNGAGAPRLTAAQNMMVGALRGLIGAYERDIADIEDEVSRIISDPDLAKESVRRYLPTLREWLPELGYPPLSRESASGGNRSS